jgi:hypothetical protein
MVFWVGVWCADDIEHADHFEWIIVLALLLGGLPTQLCWSE